jgi:hypothetical protein
VGLYWGILSREQGAGKALAGLNAALFGVGVEAESLVIGRIVRKEILLLQPFPEKLWLVLMQRCLALE